MGIFIQIEVHQSEIPLQVAEQIVSVCPVEIFAIVDQLLGLQPDREDECTLCGLCLNTAPARALIIHKLYKAEMLVSGVS